MWTTGGGAAVSKGTRRTALGKSVVGLVLALILPALLLTVAACENLESGTSSSVVETTTTVPVGTTQAASEASVFGTWEGTYTALEAWDENGIVEDPPISLHVPMELRLELHPWSEASGDYGTLSATGFASGRVTALSFDGQNLQLSIVSKIQGLEDYHTVITATLEGDTLTGEDSGDPEVPSGWLSTSGTVFLTRTGSSDTGDTEAAGAGTGAHTEGTTEEVPTEMTLLFYAAPISTTTTTERSLVHHFVYEAHDEGTLDIRVGDQVRVGLTYRPTNDVAVHFVVPDPHVMRMIDEYRSGLYTYMVCEAVAPGNTRLEAEDVDPQGTAEYSWWVDVVVTE
jgi:hypothetical protein